MRFHRLSQNQEEALIGKAAASTADGSLKVRRYTFLAHEWSMMKCILSNSSFAPVHNVHMTSVCCRCSESYIMRTLSSMTLQSIAVPWHIAIFIIEDTQWAHCAWLKASPSVCPINLPKQHNLAPCSHSGEELSKSPEDIGERR